MLIKGSSPNPSILNVPFLWKQGVFTPWGWFPQSESEWWEVKSTFCQRQSEKEDHGEGGVRKAAVWFLSHRQLPFRNVYVWRLRIWNVILQTRGASRPLRVSLCSRVEAFLGDARGSREASLEEPLSLWGQPAFPCPLGSLQWAKDGSLGPLTCEWHTHQSASTGSTDCLWKFLLVVLQNQVNMY